MTTIGIVGTGSALKDFLSILPADITVAGLGDNNPARHGRIVEGHRVMAVSDLAALAPDCVVITARAVDPIRAQLAALGVPADRIHAYYPSYSEALGAAVNADIAALNQKLGLRIAAAGVATMYLWPETPGMPQSGAGEDFVRRHAFRLAAERINAQAIPGAVGELGVYQGEQAALLNRLFPGRRLHLFDTFEGFAEKDLAAETKGQLSGAALGDFQDTSVELVLSRMADKSQVLVHKGFFPDSTQGVEDEFAFVSLDVDLYDPTAAGLAWFYPRLNQGGCIFVHDYNNRRYMGVRRAVEEFIAATGAPALPLPDHAGSIVILK